MKDLFTFHSSPRSLVFRASYVLGQSLEHLSLNDTNERWESIQELLTTECKKTTEHK